MTGNGVRKNYGGRMIFGDEKLTPLRSVPRCALGRFAPSGRLTGGYAVRGSARPSPKSFAIVQDFSYPPNVVRNSESSLQKEKPFISVCVL